MYISRTMTRDDFRYLNQKGNIKKKTKFKFKKLENFLELNTIKSVANILTFII